MKGERRGVKGRVGKATNDDQGEAKLKGGDALGKDSNVGEPEIEVL